MIKRKASNELRICGGTVLHGHYFDHVEIWLRWGLINGKNGIYDVRSKLLGERAIKFC